MVKQKKLKILAAGDLHGSEEIAEYLATKAERNKVDLVVLTGDIFSPSQKNKLIGHFRDRNLETVFVPGNWDSSSDVKFIKEVYGAENLEESYIRRGNIDFFGLGSANFKLDHNRTRDFQKIEKLFNKTKDKSSKKVLISHIHVAGSKAEFSGFGGSYVLRKIIEEHEPNIIISSHIHEAEGIEEKIKKTKIFQVGPRGKIIFI